MAKSVINVGTAANDGTGDNLRAGATKINANSDELYNALGDGTNLKDIVNGSLELDIPNDNSKINKVIHRSRNKNIHHRACHDVEYVGSVTYPSFFLS